MATVRTDDRIQAVRGRWIEARGFVLPFFLTYVTWAVFACIASMVTLLSLIGGASIKNAATFGIFLGVLAAMWASVQMSSDRGLAGVLTIELAEFRCWWSARRAKSAHRSASKPVQVSLRKVVR